MIHTSLSPNTERDDVLLALKTLLTPWMWRDVSANSSQSSARKKVELALSEKLSGAKSAKIFTVDSGRTALFTILSAAGIGAGDEVAIQAYTCVAVPEPILWVVARPLYIDCENDLTMSVSDLRKKVTAKTKAVVIQHTFGQPARVAEIVAFAREKNLLVFEDCAHALGAEVAGHQVGTFGDAAFFSFGRDKSVSSVFGGAIAIPFSSNPSFNPNFNSNEFAEKISNIVNGYSAPGFWWTAQQLMHPLVLAVAKSTYNFFSLGKIVLEIAKRLGLISKAVQQTELSGGKPTFAFHQFSPALAKLALHQLQKLSRFTEHRQSCAREYSRLLGARGDQNKTGIYAPEFVPGHSYLRYTVTTNSAESVKNYFKKARAAGIQPGDWYMTPIAPRGVQYEKIGYEMGSCPNAESLAERTFNVPTHIGITRDMIKKIVREIFE